MIPPSGQICRFRLTKSGCRLQSLMLEGFERSCCYSSTCPESFFIPFRVWRRLEQATTMFQCLSVLSYRPNDHCVIDADARPTRCGSWPSAPGRNRTLVTRVGKRGLCHLATWGSYWLHCEHDASLHLHYFCKLLIPLFCVSWTNK